MGLFDKFEGLTAARRDLETLGIDPFGVEIERIISPTEGVIHGRHTILAGTNNYLGLTFDPECIAAARRALDTEGTGTTGSRMANGSYSGHRRLEEELAEFYGMRDAIVFSTGYQANLGMLAGLTGPNDVVLLDADCHASIYDGCRLAGAEVIRFRHNDAADLAKRMRRLGARAADTLIVVEGIYSMLGRPRTAEGHRRRQARVWRLPAGGRGAFAGRAGRTRSRTRRGTGSSGGRRLHRRHVQQEPRRNRRILCAAIFLRSSLVRYSSRPYIFTASPSPATIASTRQALSILSDGRDLRARLRENYLRLHAGLTALGLHAGSVAQPGDRGGARRQARSAAILESPAAARRLRQPDAAAGDAERRFADPLQRQRRAHARTD